MIEYIFPPLFLIGATIFIAVAFPQFLGLWLGSVAIVFVGYLLDKVFSKK